MTRKMSIGEVADRAGVAASTLRYYDELGLVEPAGRVSGRRRYDEAVLRRLRIVDVCQRAGFTLEEIGRLLDGNGDWRDLSAVLLYEVADRLAQLRDARRLVQAALECDCDDLEGCADTGHDAPDQICGTTPATTTPHDRSDLPITEELT